MSGRPDSTASDLEFFYVRADGEHGKAIGGGSAQDAVRAASAAHEALIRRVPSVTKWRAIGEVLWKLPIEQQRLLRASQTALPPALRAELAPLLGDSAAIVVALYGAGPIVDLANQAKGSVERRAHLVELRVEADRALQLARFAYWQLAADRSECQAVIRRRRLTADLAKRLVEIEQPRRLLTTADLREMGAIQ